MTVTESVVADGTPTEEVVVMTILVSQPEGGLSAVNMTIIWNSST